MRTLVLVLVLVGCDGVRCEEACEGVDLCSEYSEAYDRDLCWFESDEYTGQPCPCEGSPECMDQERFAFCGN